MNVREQWKIIHAYRKLVESGKADSWTCPDDENVMISMLGEGDRPVLKCFACQNTMVPEEIEYERMREAIERIGSPIQNSESQ